MSLRGNTDVSKGKQRAVSARPRSGGRACGAAAKVCVGKGPPWGRLGRCSPRLCCAADNVTGAQLETVPFFFLIAEDKVRFLKTPKASKTFLCLPFSKELPARRESRIRSRLVKILGSIVNPQCAFCDVSIF